MFGIKKSVRSDKFRIFCPVCDTNFRHRALFGIAFLESYIPVFIRDGYRFECLRLPQWVLGPFAKQLRKSTVSWSSVWNTLTPTICTGFREIKPRLLRDQYQEYDIGIIS